MRYQYVVGRAFWLAANYCRGKQRVSIRRNFVSHLRMASPSLAARARGRAIPHDCIEQRDLEQRDEAWQPGPPRPPSQPHDARYATPLHRNLFFFLEREERPSSPSKSSTLQRPQSFVAMELAVHNRPTPSTIPTDSNSPLARDS